LIYDNKGCLSYLNGSKLKYECVDQKQLTYYGGEKFEDYKRFVEGKLDLKTLKLREPIKVNFKRVCGFLEFIPDTSSGRLNNLCARLVTFDNYDTLESNTKNSDADERKESGDSLGAREKRIKRGISFD